MSKVMVHFHSAIIQDNVQNNGSFLVQPQISLEHSATYDSNDDLNNEMDIECK